MKISCHLITWGDHFVHGMQEASTLGYQACETFTRLALQYENRIEEFKELFDQYGFRLSALYGVGRFTELANRQELLDYNVQVARFAAACGSDRIVFGPRGPRTEGGTTLEELKIAAETMNEAGKRCLELGVKACVHPHLRTEIQDESEVDAIMELTDPRYVFFCPDTAHLFRAGMDPAVIMRRYKDRIAYLHLKDVFPEQPDLSHFPILSGDEQMPIFCELGLGPVDFPSVIEVLKEINYDGWLTVEIDRSLSTPINSLRICKEYIENKLGLTLAV
ncbi:sugar phosphate isomerase/epimerase family protein [Paenibacillus koleovorans]|uniref:sugar phosphate isomerase/epimerase family protein n=1 Tax=Paenibacillus koleovorans TaxID=121608 RepID=UPI000FDC452E|nr:sugar phosphate isomerase/epimerase family protein [Paenibacillus koleovorans]